MDKKVIIVGSGIAGLACAIRLASAGYMVKVFEANNTVGGKLGQTEINGFRFDTGPSLLTLPHLIDELFTLTKKNPTAYFTYTQLEKNCNYFYPDGTHFSAYFNRQRFAEELKDKLGMPDAKPLFNYLDKSAKLYHALAPLFVQKPLLGIKSFLSIAALKGAVVLLKNGLSKTMNKVNEKSFKDKKLVQYFNRFATYNGSSPYKAPSVLNMIPHLEHNVGAFIPKHGMYQIVTALHKLATELGVEFVLNSKVTEIVMTANSKKTKSVEGIKVGNTKYLADIVISNADITHTYKNLLPYENKPINILKQEKSSSALIFYWGINKTFEQLDAHNIFFASDYRQEFRHLFGFNTVYYDPTIYINITSKYVSGDAPADCENWFVMINVPNNTNQNWDQLIITARKNIITKINRTLSVNIEQHIVCENMLDPRGIEQKTGSVAGALYGNSSNNKYAAFLRHKNFSTQINGLYFCGGSVHPGGGIPLCLNSAKIVANLIQQKNA